MLADISGYWRKESDEFKGYFDYMYVDCNSREAVSSITISIYPLKLIFFHAILGMEKNGVLLVRNKKTGHVQENHFKLIGNFLNWSLDGVNFWSWEKLHENLLSQIPEQMRDMVFRLQEKNPRADQ